MTSYSGYRNAESTNCILGKLHLFKWQYLVSVQSPLNYVLQSWMVAKHARVLQTDTYLKVVGHVKNLTDIDKAILFALKLSGYQCGELSV